MHQDDYCPQDLRLGMRFVYSERPLVYVGDEVFGILVFQDEGDDSWKAVAECAVPVGDDSTVTPDNISSLNERFQVCYEPSRKLMLGMTFVLVGDEDKSDKDDSRYGNIGVMGGDGVYLGRLCRVSELLFYPRQDLPLRLIDASSPECYQRGEDLPEWMKRPIDEESLDDLEEYCISRPPLSQLLHEMFNEGIDLRQKVSGDCGLDMWQSSYLEDREIVVNLYKSSKPTMRHRLNIDTLTWS